MTWDMFANGLDLPSNGNLKKNVIHYSLHHFQANKSNSRKKKHDKPKQDDDTAFHSQEKT